MLSTIAGSMMTVVGVTFSMVLMTLALASSQYTSRILRNFMRDRVTQVVLGIFAGIFTYCLIVLRTIRGGEDGGFVPSLAVSFGVVLAMGGIGVLIFFIHHIAASIQASNIIASVADETMLAVDRLFPEKLGNGRLTTMRISHRSLCRSGIWQAVPARGMGISKAWTTRRCCVWRGSTRPSCGWNAASASLWSGGHARSLRSLWKTTGKEIIAALQAAYSIDRHRTVNRMPLSASDRSWISR
jgi:hypothetical protein